MHHHVSWAAQAAFSTPVSKIAGPNDDTVLLAKAPERNQHVQSRTQQNAAAARQTYMAGTPPILLRFHIETNLRSAVTNAQRKIHLNQGEAGYEEAWNYLADLCRFHRGWGEWALYIAIEEDAFEVLERLLLMRYNPLQLFPAELSPVKVEQRVDEKDESAAEGALLSFGEEEQQQDENPAVLSLLDVALRCEKPRVAAILLRHIPISMRNGKGEFPLEKAIAENHGSAVLELMRSGVITRAAVLERMSSLQAVAGATANKPLQEFLASLIQPSSPKSEPQPAVAPEAASNTDDDAQIARDAKSRILMRAVLHAPSSSISAGLRVFDYHV